jgi:putative heme-binding domain-containing protein
MRCITVALFALAPICVAQNPLTGDKQAAEHGRVAFRIYCAPCHGIKAQGGRGPDLTRGVYSSGETDSDLFRTIKNGVSGTEMPSFSEDFSDDTIWRLVSYIRSTSTHDTGPPSGDPSAGNEIFWGKGGCGNCHKVATKGGVLGPDLTRAGRQRSYAYLQESVLQPDADITPGYETITAVTKDGKKLTGVNRGFDNFSAQFMDAGGHFYSFEKAEVNSLTREERSLMPKNYSSRLSAGELKDLLAYLTTLKGNQ